MFQKKAAVKKIFNIRQTGKEIVPYLKLRFMQGLVQRIQRLIVMTNEGKKIKAEITSSENK